MTKQAWSSFIHPFVTPFWPKYRPDSKKNNGVLNDKDIDYSHEREWRVPHDFTFKYSDIEFVILDSVEDLQSVGDDLVKKVGVKKFLFMDNYRQIENLWPVHNLES